MSYDLVATKPFIIEADISHLPIKDQSVDVAVFCLSLMGTNFSEFLLEAKRVLRPKGKLIVAEVSSRCQDWADFDIYLQKIGFIDRKPLLTPDFFRIYAYRNSQPLPDNLPEPPTLKSCLYKKR